MKWVGEAVQKNAGRKKVNLLGEKIQKNIVIIILYVNIYGNLKSCPHRIPMKKICNYN